jgi:hypothetical protein
MEHRAELCWVGRTRLGGVVPAAEVVSAITPRGRVQFMIVSAGIEPALPREFLLRLSGPQRRAVHVILDGSWGAGDWPRRLPRRIVTHVLPSCERPAPLPAS